MPVSKKYWSANNSISKIVFKRIPHCFFIINYYISAQKIPTVRKNAHGSIMYADSCETGSGDIRNPQLVEAKSHAHAVRSSYRCDTLSWRWGFRQKRPPSCLQELTISLQKRRYGFVIWFSQRFSKNQVRKFSKNLDIIITFSVFLIW